ncbi:MAG TPA: HlyD family secretion protein [Burkholderiales bacterium]
MSLPTFAKITSAAILTAVAAGSFFYLDRSEADAARQSTDDAYVQADYTVVAPQVSGRITQVLVADNQPVKPGDLIATIDDRDYAIAVDMARAQVLSAQAAIESLRAGLTRQGAVIHQARATVEADDAAVTLARANQARYSNLAADGSGTVQALQQAEAQLRIQQAGREKNQAAFESTRQQTDILRADLQKAHAAEAQARAQLAEAELKLSYTRITAPLAGTVGEKSVRVGAFVTAGKPLLAIVPLSAIYIEANYRETQLYHVHPGQPVSIRVDALPGVTLKGHVDSMAPASGVTYAAIAPHNATGNFTKIVQRLPVRISIDAGQEEAGRLRVGMSVQPEIDVGRKGAA